MFVAHAWLARREGCAYGIGMVARRRVLGCTLDVKLKALSILRLVLMMASGSGRWSCLSGACKGGRCRRDEIGPSAVRIRGWVWNAAAAFHDGSSATARWIRGWDYPLSLQVAQALYMYTVTSSLVPFASRW